MFGSREFWEPDYFELNGAEDIVGMFFGAKSIGEGFAGYGDPRVNVSGGVSQVFIDPEVRDRLDKLLGHLESHDGISGSGTMLILGDSSLFSRFPLHETRMVMPMPYSCRFSIITVLDHLDLLW